MCENVLLYIKNVLSIFKYCLILHANGHTSGNARWIKLCPRHLVKNSYNSFKKYSACVEIESVITPSAVVLNAPNSTKFAWKWAKLRLELSCNEFNLSPKECTLQGMNLTSLPRNVLCRGWRWPEGSWGWKDDGILCSSLLVYGFFFILEPPLLCLKDYLSAFWTFEEHYVLSVSRVYIKSLEWKRKELHQIRG